MGSISSAKDQSLRLLPCEPTDADEIVAIQSAAFGCPPEPFFYVLFPEDEERETAVKRTVDWWLGDPSAKYLKVVDGSGRIISAAKWCIYENQLTEEQMNEKLHVDWHRDADTNAWSEYLIHFIHQYRIGKSKGEPCCVLDILATHPDYQRRGAGSMLVKWGTDIADKMGVKSFIEGTPHAKHLYESNGFISSEDWIRIPVEDRWKDRPEIKYYFFQRPAKAGVVETKS